MNRSDLRKIILTNTLRDLRRRRLDLMDARSTAGLSREVAARVRIDQRRTGDHAVPYALAKWLGREPTQAERMTASRAVTDLVAAGWLLRYQNAGTLWLKVMREK